MNNPLRAILQPPPAPPTLKPTQTDLRRAVVVDNRVLSRPMQGNVLGGTSGAFHG